MPSVTLDLGAAFAVTSVTLVQRSDSGLFTPGSFQILLGNTPPPGAAWGTASVGSISTSWTNTLLSFNPACYYQANGGIASPAGSFACVGVGRYITLQGFITDSITQTPQLMLCAMFVFGAPIAGPGGGAVSYPPMPMMANTQSYAAAGGNYPATAVGAYIASSSSSLGGWSAYGAFDDVFYADGPHSWASSTQVFSPTGSYIGTASTTTASGAVLAGEWLQLQLPSPLVLSAYLLATTASSNFFPSSWTLLGSNDGSTWAVVESRSGMALAPSSSPPSSFFVSSIPAAYSVFRLVITANVNLGSGSSTQYCVVSELQLFGGPGFLSFPYPTLATNTQTNAAVGAYPPAAAGAYIASASSSLSGWSPYGAFDGSLYSDGPHSWASSTQSMNTAGAYTGAYTTPVAGFAALPGEWLQLQLPSPLVLSAYLLATTASNNFLPYNWTLLGSLDGVSWASVDSQIGQTLARGGARYFSVYAANSAAAYSYFRLVITANLAQSSGAQYVVVGEMQLFGYFPAYGGVAALSLPGRGLRGTLPQQLAELRTLVSADLSNNRLSGSFPAGWGVPYYWNATLPPRSSGFDQLKLLNLYQNSLNGTIPTALGSFPTGPWLGVRLFDNQLSGTLPPLTAAGVGFLSIAYNPLLVGPLPLGLPLYGDVQLSVLGTAPGVPTPTIGGVASSNPLSYSLNSGMSTSRVLLGTSIGLDVPLVTILAGVKSALDPTGSFLSSWNFSATNQPCPPYTGSLNAAQNASSGRLGYGGAWAGVVCVDAFAYNGYPSSFTTPSSQYPAPVPAGMPCPSTGPGGNSMQAFGGSCYYLDFPSSAGIQGTCSYPGSFAAPNPSAAMNSMCLSTNPQPAGWSSGSPPSGSACTFWQNIYAYSQTLSSSTTIGIAGTGWISQWPVYNAQSPSSWNNFGCTNTAIFGQQAIANYGGCPFFYGGSPTAPPTNLGLTLCVLPPAPPGSGGALLALSGLGLNGTLPTQLQQLKTAVTLDLSNNKLTGSLPQSWCVKTLIIFNFAFAPGLQLQPAF